MSDVCRFPGVAAKSLETALKADAPSGSAPDVLVLSPAIREAIMLHLLDAAPNEGVGLLAARSRETGSVLDAVHFYPGSNIANSPTRFAMDPHEVLITIRDIRRNGWELGAIIHSHLFGPASPSEIDLAEAHYPEALMVIVSFAKQPAIIRAWHIEQEQEQKVVRGVRIEAEFGQDAVRKSPDLAS